MPEFQEGRAPGVSRIAMAVSFDDSAGGWWCHATNKEAKASGQLILVSSRWLVHRNFRLVADASGS